MRREAVERRQRSREGHLPAHLEYPAGYYRKHRHARDADDDDRQHRPDAFAEHLRRRVLEPREDEDHQHIHEEAVGAGLM
ncbi:hypothetical protein SDC9_139775 [bioreactor metagenome]|uniref:Uncharacterized protein n=1 Tax=bioreactor metagenome TaxID=1076179 RepID=A0A645DT22_9ZZZZ